MRRLSADEVGLWRRAMRDVAPLPGRPPFPHAVPAPRPVPVDPFPDLPPRASEGNKGAVRSRMPELAIVEAPRDVVPGVDRRSTQRLRRGRTAVEGRLDLHGMTQAEAHRALAGFVAAARRGGRRCVLVITGHGRAGGGILKASVPRWLAEPELRHHVLALAPAQPRDGGSGALYLLLRKLTPVP